MSNSDKDFESIVSIAQSLLRKDRERGSINPTVIAEKVALAVSVVAPDEQVDVQPCILELIRRNSRWIGQDSILQDDSDHQAWLNASRKKDWRYWQRYQVWQEKKLSTSIVDALDKSTDQILGKLEDPNRPGNWARRGLVVGHVQSGKTGNYSGLICKAADAGYKIIVVLAGLHNNLRSQTQMRLEEGFLGYETAGMLEMGRLLGVGEIDGDLRIQPNCATTRTNNGDFNTKAAKHLAISPEQRPWLFVVKKNKTVLERLLKWIKAHVADSTDSSGHPIVTTFPLLLIDDEADHASVDTGEQLFDEEGKPDEDHQPKAINSRIRRILRSFSKSAYVGYTATPFANIFIHRRAATVEEGPDLFPSSFIINLAAPSNYFGPARVFGLLGLDGRVGGLPLTRPVADQIDDNKLTGWMPPKHKKDHVPLFEDEAVVPPSLREAINAFVLCCAIRICRGQATQHSSMLIHVTRFNWVQSEVYQQVDQIIARMRQRAVRNVDAQKLQADLKGLWEDDFLPTSRLVDEGLPAEERQLVNVTWEMIWEVIPEVLTDIDVRMINGTAKDALDYAENDANGLKIIAIGGEKLARGLTLEGLCVSYFVRTTKMYDTLMQMGRWFGYRPGYIDLCRLYTTDEMVEWFQHIADASEELREEFDAMVASGATPREFGLKVQSHPTLMVTSPLKMRTAKSLQLSFSGELLETVAFRKELGAVAANLEATNRLITAMGNPESRPPSQFRDGKIQRWDGYVWNKVSAEKVVDFLSAFVTHPRSRKVNGPMLAEFVQSMADAASELNSWTVVLLDGGTGRPHAFANNLLVKAMFKRTGNPDVKDGYSIGRLLSPRDEAIDLDEPAWNAALDLTIKSWKPDAGRQKDGAKPRPPEVPNGPAIRRIRGFGAEGVEKHPERGVLLLYPLDPREAENVQFDDFDTPVMAFGASFPGSQSGTKVEYKVDHLLWEQEYGGAD